MRLNVRRAHYHVVKQRAGSFYHLAREHLYHFLEILEKGN